MSWLALLVALCIVHATNQFQMKVDLSKLTGKSDKTQTKKSVDALKQQVEIINKTMRLQMENITKKLENLENSQAHTEMGMTKQISDLKEVVSDTASTTDGQTEKIVKLQNDQTQRQTELKKQISDLKDTVADSVTKTEAQNEKLDKLQGEQTHQQTEVNNTISDLKDIVEDTVSKTDVQTGKLAKFQTEQTQKQKEIEKTISDLKNTVADSVTKTEALNANITKEIHDIVRQVVELNRNVASISLKTETPVDQCPSPPEIINGAHMVKIDGRGIGAKAIYACQKEDMMCDTSSTLTCQDTKTWDDGNFRCAQKHFINVKVPSNSKMGVAIPCGKFDQGKSVTIIGTPYARVRCTFALMDDTGETAIELDIRFNYHGLNYMVVNSFISGSWGQEVEHNEDFPCAIGKQFEIVFKFDQNGYQVFINRKKYFTFLPRKSTLKATKLVFSNEMTLHSIEFSTP